MPTPAESKALSSLWDGLSPHLIATFYEVARLENGEWGRIEGQTDPVSVKAPLTDANFEAVLNWQSPFEQSGPESKAPALLAMLQSGEAQVSVDAIGDALGIDDAQQKSAAFLKKFEGRTGVTKLNSTQVFDGMRPIKITATALFRAWEDSNGEVEAPFNKLMEWSLPKSLAKDGSILARAIQAVKGSMEYTEALMPSVVPARIALLYKGRTFSPLVIESIGMPLSSPVDKSGRFVQLAVPLTLCSLTALDRADWAESHPIIWRAL